MKKNLWVVFLLVLCSSVCAARVDLKTEVIGHSLTSEGKFGVRWDTPRSAWIPKTDKPPQIDAKLDDPCWSDAALLTGFTRGARNAARPYANRVRVCYDDGYLYLFGEFEEPNPDQIDAAVKENGNVEIWTDDAFEIHIEVDLKKVFSPKYDGPCWMQFITNSVGAKFVQFRWRHAKGVSSRARPWNDEWLSAARVGENAWYSEVAIPWKLLKFTPVEVESFRMNVGRNRHREGESWNTRGYHQPARFGKVFFGREKATGIEIREAWVECAGGDWTASVVAVAPGPDAIDARLRVAVKRGDRVVSRSESEATAVGRKPVTLVAPVAAPEEDGDYSVEVEVTSAGGKSSGLGRAHAERQPFVQRMFLFRRDFAAGEETIKGYYRLAAVPQNSKLRADFSLARDGEVLARATIPRITAREGQYDFHVPPMTEGVYTFRSRIADDKGRVSEEIQREIRVKRYVPAKRERVRLHVDEPAGVARKAWPITAGVPFGRGMLSVKDVEEHTRVLDAEGRELPCQTQLTATWTDAGLFARWVLFDFQGDLAANEGAEFFVEFGTEVKRTAKASPPLAQAEPDGAITVDTGVLSRRFSPDTPLFFSDMRLNGRPVTQRPESGELSLMLADPSEMGKLLPHQHAYRTDRSTRTFLAELARDGYAVEIERAGAIRSVIKATGWYADKEGNRLFRYILRLHFHAGKPWLEAHHTWIATEPEQYVYSMGLRLQGTRQPVRSLFGGDGDQVTELPARSMVNEQALIQPSPEYWRLLEYERQWTEWGAQRASGHRAAGWVDVAFTGDVGALVAIKDFWREFPKEIAVLQEGAIEVGLSGRRSPAHLDLRSSPHVKEEQATGNSQGVAKTTRLVLHFHRPDADAAEAALRARAALADLAVRVDPEWMQRADPFWAPVADCGPDSEDPLKRAFANHVGMYAPRQPQAPEVVHGLWLYGLLNYGDRIHGMATRGWFNNEDYALPYKEWVGYLSTGNRVLLDGLTCFVRHLIDVDTLNYTTGDPGDLGLQSRHRRLHWGQPSIITHTYLDQSLLYYYLFGYERGADHAELVRRGQRVWTWWPARGWYTRESPTGAVSRDYGVNLRILMNAYRHCWDPVLLVRAHELWARYAEGFRPDGSHRVGYFNVPRGAELYVRYTADPEAIKAVLNSDMECPLLRASLGRAEPLRKWLGEVERTLSNAHEKVEAPWYALLHPQHAPHLVTTTALGAAEKARREGKPLEPVRGGQLAFWGDMDILFLEETDREHSIEVKIWKTNDTEKSRAILFDTTGASIVDKTFSTKELPPMTHGNILRLKIPKDGRTGQYLLRLSGLDGGYMYAWLAEGPAKRVFLFKRPTLSLGAFWGTRFWFYVPKDCARFRLGGEPRNRTYRFGFAVYDPANRLAGVRNWYHDPHITASEVRWLDVEVPPDARGAWWNVPYICLKGLQFTWPKELPAYLTDSPNAGFLPDMGYLERVKEK